METNGTTPAEMVETTFGTERLRDFAESMTVAAMTAKHGDELGELVATNAHGVEYGVVTAWASTDGSPRFRVGFREDMPEDVAHELAEAVYYALPEPTTAALIEGDLVAEGFMIEAEPSISEPADIRAQGAAHSDPEFAEFVRQAVETAEAEGLRVRLDVVRDLNPDAAKPYAVTVHVTDEPANRSHGIKALAGRT